MFCVVPDDRGGGFSVEVELSEIGEDKVDEAIKLFYTLGAGSMRIKYPGASYKILPRVRRLRSELHGLMATVAGENEVQVTFSGELFTSLDEGVKSFLISLSTAARAAAENLGTGDWESVMSEVSECLLQARAISRHVSWMITRPSRGLIMQAIPLAGALSARFIDLCVGFEEALRLGMTREELMTLSALASGLAEAVDQGATSVEHVLGEIRMAVEKTPRDRYAAYQLLNTLALTAETLRQLVFLRMVTVR